MSIEKAKMMRKEILEGPIEGTLFKLAWPIIINNLIQVLYNITDTFWLGKLGRAALSAPGVSWPIIGTLMALGIGFTMAGFSIVGQYIGAGNFEKANRSAGALFSLIIFFSTASAILSILILPYALSFMHVTSSIRPYAYKYSLIIFAGVPMSFLFMTFNVLMRAIGDTRTPVKISLITVFLNIILDPIFIFILNLGVEGAALATVLSNSVGTVIGVRILTSGRAGLKISRENLKPDWKFYSKIVRIGLPSSIGQSANSFGFVVLTRIIMGFGDVTYAAYVITTRLVNFITSISRGISMAMSTMVAQNIGAENYERAKVIAERTMVINFLIAGIAVLIIGIFRVPIFKVFLNDPMVIAESKIVLEYFLISVPFFNGIFVVVTGAFSSSGHTVKSMIMSMLRLWGFRIPLSYVFGYVPTFAKLFGFTSRGVFFGMGLSNFLAAIVGLAWFLKGSWMRKIIE
ncbi:MATE family efflux transporter [Pyrococcus horikoshii]|nr:MATE family efflux transporter [Pyrococcus horikoshii]HII60859.1 MATE family efflux transporter [Pyrococcus horikoshii]